MVGKKKKKSLIEDRVATLMNALHGNDKTLIGPSISLLVRCDARHKMAAVGGFVCTLARLDVIALNR